MILNELDSKQIQRQLVFDRAVALLHRAMPRPSAFMVPLHEDWKVFEESNLVSHVISLKAVYERSEPPLQCSTAFAELLCHTGRYLYERHINQESLAILDLGERVCSNLKELPNWRYRKEDGVDNTPQNGVAQSQRLRLTVHDLDTLEANIITYAAGLHGNLSGLSERHIADEKTRRCLELRIRHMSDTTECGQTLSDHLLLANAYNDVGFQYLDNEDYDKAEAPLLKSLEMKSLRQAEGKIDGFEFAESKKNLAIVYLARGKKDAALELIEEASGILMLEEGPTDPSTLLCKFMWATILLHDGQLERSLNLHREVLDIRLKIFGTAGIATLHSFYAVAHVHFALSDISAAKHVLPISNVWHTS